MTTVDESRGVPLAAPSKAAAVPKPPVAPETPAQPVPPPSDSPATPADQVVIAERTRQLQAEGSAPVSADIPPLDKARADKALSKVRQMMGYGHNDWEINKAETVRALDRLMTLPDAEFHYAVQRLKTEDGGRYYQRLKENLAEEGLQGILALREDAPAIRASLQAQGLPAPAVGPALNGMMAATLAAQVFTARLAAEYDVMEHAQKWMEPLAGALPEGVRQAAGDEGLFRRPHSGQLPKLLQGAPGQEQALAKDLRLSDAAAARFLDLLRQASTFLGN